VKKGGNFLVVEGGTSHPLRKENGPYLLERWWETRKSVIILWKGGEKGKISQLERDKGWVFLPPEKELGEENPFANLGKEVKGMQGIISIPKREIKRRKSYSFLNGKEAGGEGKKFSMLGGRKSINHPEKKGGAVRGRRKISQERDIPQSKK